jgi:hypothetical protein
VNFVQRQCFYIIFHLFFGHQRREAVVLIHVEHNWLHQRHYFLGVIPIAFNRSCNQLGDGFTVIPEMVTPQ